MKLLRAFCIVCALLCCGRVAAQPLACTGNMATALIPVQSQIFVNRATPPGELVNAPSITHSAARVQCTNGTPGMPIEIAFRLPAGVTSRANPFGPGLLLDTPAPGVGIVLHTISPQVLASPFQVMQTTTRNSSVTQLMAYTEVRMQFARDPATPLDLERTFAVHSMPLMEVVWRSPGFQDEWQLATTYRLNNLAAGTRNVLTETCFFGANSTETFARTENLGPVRAGDFTGIGSEPAISNLAGSLILTCRNYAGGRMSVESSSANPTMPGIMDNTLTGPMASQGVGVRLRHGVGGNPWDLLVPWAISPQGLRVSDTLLFNYNARYVQTEPTVRAGQFKSTVTFTVHYD